MTRRGIIENSHLKVNSQGQVTTFVGRDGVGLFQAIALKSGLGLYRKTGIKPNQAWTPTAMLAAAGHITGHKYKRGQFLQAEADLQAWIDAMRCALPVLGSES